MKEAELRKLDPRDFNEVVLTEGEMLEWFDVADAYWMHDGNPENPHAELVSGLCSNGFLVCSKILKIPNVNEILARQLVRKLKEAKMYNVQNIEWVVGSAYSAITFSYEIAKGINLGVLHAHTEKDPGDSKKQIWKKHTIPESVPVLQIEELMTTSQTFQAVRRAIREKNEYPVNFLPVVGTLVHRPRKLLKSYAIKDQEEEVKIKIISLIEKEIWALPQEECPLCAAGSVRLKPKFKDNWKKLTGKN